MALLLFLPGALADSTGAAGATAACLRTGAITPPADKDTDYRCTLLMRLIERGLDPGGDIGQQVLAELARPYVTVLELTGDALLPAPALEFLLGELPDMARMINFYQSTRYEVVYLKQDRSRFYATNNRTMQATFTQFQTRETGDYLLFERGQARLLFWQLNGSTIIDFRIDPQQQKTRYYFKIHIFTDSPGFHAFFESGVFSFVARTIVRGIIEDMAEAANKLVGSGHTLPALSPGFAEGVRSCILNEIKESCGTPPVVQNARPDPRATRRSPIWPGCVVCPHRSP